MKANDNKIHPEKRCATEKAVTFCDVPGHATKKDLAGVQRILVVSGRQLATPSECGLIHSWWVHKKGLLGFAPIRFVAIVRVTNLPAACLCKRASLSMLNVSSDWSSMSEPGHGQPERQRREMDEEAGLALGGGVRGELVSWGSRREPSRSRSFCMFDAK